ncbi:MAG: hypothetical protein AAF756_16845 [Pseudomonadota bacterium]
MIKTVAKFLSTIAFIASAHVNAALINFELTYGATAVTPDGGVGSFVWDDAALLISDFVWDFGGGDVGGYEQSLFDDSGELFGPGSTRSTILFEPLTGQDVGPFGICPFCGLDSLPSRVSNFYKSRITKAAAAD